MKIMGHWYFVRLAASFCGPCSGFPYVLLVKGERAMIKRGPALISLRATIICGVADVSEGIVGSLGAP